MDPKIIERDGRTIIKHETIEDGKKYIVERDITLQEEIRKDLRTMKWLQSIMIAGLAFAGIVGLWIIFRLDAINILSALI